MQTNIRDRLTATSIAILEITKNKHNNEGLINYENWLREQVSLIIEDLQNISKSLNTGDNKINRSK